MDFFNTLSQKRAFSCGGRPKKSPARGRVKVRLAGMNSDGLAQPHGVGKAFASRQLSTFQSDARPTKFQAKKEAARRGNVGEGGLWIEREYGHQSIRAESSDP